jgi:hypothetical protein
MMHQHQVVPIQRRIEREVGRSTARTPVRGDMESGMGVVEREEEVTRRTEASDGLRILENDNTRFLVILRLLNQGFI